MTDTIYIVDVFSLMFQVFHAIPSMTSPRGLPTNAVFGFTRDLLGILRDKQPTHLVCAMDSPGPGEREAMYPEYKANRDEMPEDLRPQIDLIKQVMQGLRVPAIEHAGWEADDVLATLTRHAVDEGMQIRIVSSDKDLRQMLGPRVQIYNVRKNLFQDEEFLLKESGVRPDQVIDFQALVGDSSDNVPGVPLVGPKKARTLLDKFATLDEVLARAGEAPGKKLSENLVTFADQARLSRQLVTLRQDLPLEIDWERFRVQLPDHESLLQLFTELGFRRLADDMRTAVLAAAPQSEQSCECIAVQTEPALIKLAAQLRAHPSAAIKLVLDGRHLRGHVSAWAISCGSGTGYYIPRAPGGLEQALIVEHLRPLLEDPQRRWQCEDAKQVWLQLDRLGIHMQGLDLDLSVADYLLDAGARERSVDKLAERYLHERLVEVGTAGNNKVQQTMFDEDQEDSLGAVDHAARDAEAILRIAEPIQQLLASEHLRELYEELERPLIPVLAEMELNGIRIDVEDLREQSQRAGHYLQQLMGEIYELAGHEFNIDSPKQLSTVLFDELQLPVFKKTKTGSSTNQDVLEKLAEVHALPAKIIEHRQFTKLKGTYLDALPKLQNPDTGRIHATFHQVVAATGRLSSSDPNLQNIPIRTEEGRTVRRAFIPREPGWQLLCADYSQIELRMLAHFSQDPELCHAFAEGEDIHTAVASEIYGVPASEVQSAMRRIAKAVNFGVIYGQTPWGLSAALGITKGEAATFITNYFARFASVSAFTERILDECAESGYAYTILGRRRPISGIRTQRSSQRNLPERTAINTVIQGSAADLIKQAMINIHQRMQESQQSARMLLQIHDELVFEVPDAEVAEFAELVRHEMERALDLTVPVVVDVSAGPNWLDQEPLPAVR